MKQWIKNRIIPLSRGGLALLALLLFPPMLGAQSLGIGVEDLRIEQSLEGGYYLYVRKKPEISSILLTESTEDPLRRVASYSLRNPEYHPENGDELRLLDGEILPSEGIYSLIDSTPVSDEQFGLAFRIYIPYIVIFGYEWSRQGEIYVHDGTYLSVRAFELPYADYRGAFEDNPFIIRVNQRPADIRPPEPPQQPEPAADIEPEPEPTVEKQTVPDDPRYMSDTVESFSRIAENTEGRVLYSEGEEDILTQIDDILSGETGDSLDLVLALDSTESMENDMPFLREHLGRVIEENSIGFSSIRTGFVYYRDYFEEYLYRISPFEEGVESVPAILARIRPMGGRDIPEAVNEALYAALDEFSWQAENRKIILIGDAPPHPRPRGRISAEMVEELAAELGVSIHVIILPH